MNLKNLVKKNYEKYKGYAGSGLDYLKKIPRRAAMAAAVISVLAVGKAQAVPDWFVQMESNLNNYADNWSIGTDSSASDGFDYNDFMQPPGPPSNSIQFYSVVDNTVLAGDIKNTLAPYETKTWEGLLVATDHYFIGFSGTNNLSWGTLPEGYNFNLIDYGTDNTRTNVVNSIDMGFQSSYSFPVQDALGLYRNINVDVERIPEPATLGLMGLGAMAMAYRRRQGENSR